MLTIAFIAWVGYEILCGIATVGVMAKMSRDKKEERAAEIAKDAGEDDQE